MEKHHCQSIKQPLLQAISQQCSTGEQHHGTNPTHHHSPAPGPHLERKQQDTKLQNTANLYPFSMAAITNYHELGDLKHKFIILWFWRSEVQNGSHVGEKNQGVSREGLNSFGGSRREPSSFPFPPSKGHLHSLAYGPFLHLQRQQYSISDSLSLTSASFVTSPPTLTLLPPSLRTFVIIMRNYSPSNTAPFYR